MPIPLALPVIILAAEAAAELRAFAAIGVDHVALAFPSRDADGLRREVERFVTEVRPLV